MRVNEKLSSDKNQPGDLFTATLVQPLIANGLVIAQPGQNIAGRVSEAVKAKDGNGRSRLGLELTELSLVDGQQVPIRTQLIEYHRPTNNGRDTGVVFGTTAAGAAIGAVAGGGFGAGVGALSGSYGRSYRCGGHTRARDRDLSGSDADIPHDRPGHDLDGTVRRRVPAGAQQITSPISQVQPRQSAVAPPAPTTAVTMGRIRIRTMIRTFTIPTFTGRASGSIYGGGYGFGGGRFPRRRFPWRRRLPRRWRCSAAAAVVVSRRRWATGRDPQDLVRKTSIGTSTMCSGGLSFCVTMYCSLFWPSPL